MPDLLVYPFAFAAHHCSTCTTTLSKIRKPLQSLLLALLYLLFGLWIRLAGS